MLKDVCFIIPCYKPSIANLQNLLAATSGYPRIIIDNTDTEKDRVINIIKNKKIISADDQIISPGKNIGYGAAANIGLRIALKKPFSWSIILNDDIITDNKSIKAFTQLLFKKRPGIAGVFAGKLDPKRWTTIYQSPADRNKTGAECDYLSGEFFAIHHDVINKIGFFNEEYFLYYEEVDYCIRAKKSGYKLFHIPVNGINHDKVIRESRLSAQLRHYYLARNHLLFLYHNAPKVVRLREKLRFPRTFWQHFRKGEWTAIRGLLDYYKGKFGRFEAKI